MHNSYCNRLPANFNSHDLKKLNEKSAAKDCIQQGKDEDFAEEHHHGKARGKQCHPHL